MSPIPAEIFRDLWISFYRWLPVGWAKLRPIPLVYVALTMMAGYAVWDARTPVIMISPFQLPNAKLPFTGEMAANALQDGLQTIHNEIEEEKHEPGLRASDTGLPDLRNMLIPAFRRVQPPPRFAVEIKGVSYERLLSIAREIMGTETTVSGDVTQENGKIVLIARASDSGPWRSAPAPISADGLKQASKDLAEKILEAQNPTLAAVALLKDHQIDKGLAMLNRAQVENPKDPRIKLNSCMGFAANRRYKEAIDCYQDVQKMDPSSTEGLEGLAQALYLEGKREDAIRLYKELTYQRGRRDALLGLGETLDASDEHQQALDKYDEFLSREHLARNLAIAHTKKSVAFANLGKHDKSLDELEKALKYAPRDVLILAQRGLEYAQAGDLDAGIAQLSSVVDENKDAESVPFALFQLGVLLQQKGDHRSAILQYREAIRYRPNYVEAHLKLARALVLEGDQREALAEYRTVAALSPSDLDRGNAHILANQWLGNALQEQGDYASAASAYRAAIQLNSEYGPAHCELGLVLQKQGQLRQAIHEYSAALVPPKLTEVDGTKRLATAHFRLGTALIKAGRANRANGTAELRRAIELDPDHFESHLYLGEILYEEANWVEAAAEYRKATLIESRSAAAHNGLGLALDKQGLREEAGLEFARAIDLEPKNARYRASLTVTVGHEISNEKVVVERGTIARLGPP